MMEVARWTSRRRKNLATEYFASDTASISIRYNRWFRNIAWARLIRVRAT